MANKKGRSKSKGAHNVSGTPVEEIDILRAQATLYMAGYSHGAPQHHAAPPPAARGRSAGHAGGTKSGRTSRAASVTREITFTQIVKRRFDSAVLRYKKLGAIAGHTWKRMDLLAKALELQTNHDKSGVLDALSDHSTALQHFYDEATEMFPQTASLNGTPLIMKDVSQSTHYKYIFGKNLKYLHDKNYPWDKRISKFTLAALILQRETSKDKNMELIQFLEKHTNASDDGRRMANEYFTKYSQTTEDHAYREYSVRSGPSPKRAVAQHGTRSQAMPATAPRGSEQEESLVGSDASLQSSSYETHYTTAAVPDEYRI